MTDILALPMIQILGLTLLHFLWQGSIVGIVLFVMLCLLHRPQTRYVVSCAALLALAILPIVTFANLYEAPIKVAPPVQQDSGVVIPDATENEVGLEPTPTSTEQQAQTLVEKSKLTLYLPWIVLAWFVGAFVFSCKLLFSFITLQRYKTKGVKLAGQSLQLKLLEFAKRLNVKQHITLLESKLVPVPVVLGWLRPVILLPTSVVTGLSPKQLEMLLAHELAHVLRRDYLVNVLQSVLESLLFYHPVVWWVSGQIRKEREYCCDDLAVSLTGNSQQYAQTLLTLAEMRVQLAPSANGGQLLTRISRLLQPLETEMRPSYWFAGLSVLGVLTALALTVMNVSNAQEDTPQLWVTVVGDVEFSNEYTQIGNMAPDAYIVIEERNGTEIKKVRVHVETDSTSQTTFNLTESFEYTVNDQSAPFDRAWYEQAFEDSIQAIYSKTPEAEREDFVSGENETEQYKVYLLVDRDDMFKSSFFNATNAIWEVQPTSQDLLNIYRDDLRQQLQLYSAGVLSDRSYAGYLDGVTSDSNFPSELFPVALENATEISDEVLQEQLVALIEKHQAEPREPTPITASSQTEESAANIEVTPSPDGKNRISGRVTSEGQPVPHAQVSLSIPLDAEVDPGLIIANTGSNKNGEFTFSGFPIPSGKYDLFIDTENFFQGTYPPTIEINSQELVVTLGAKKLFDIVKPASDSTVSTTPSFSWQGTTDADRYLVLVWERTNREQVVSQMVDTTNLTLELPLSPNREYTWMVLAYDRYGKMINTSRIDDFKTE
jgi:beta-lactamase regulating signal transducer with metallopeptidase domain